MLRWLATGTGDLYFYKIVRVVLIHIQVLESLTRKLWQKEPMRTEEIAEIDDELEFQFRWVTEVCCQFTKREIDKNVAQLVKNLPALWETWIWPLGWEDPLEKGMATHSNILAWRSPWTVYSPLRLQRVGHDGGTFTFTNFWSKKTYTWYVINLKFEIYNHICQNIYFI